MTTENTDKGQTAAEADSQGHCALGDGSPSEALRITTLDAKYTVVLTNEGHLKALRYGQPWRDCIGDGLILTLAQEIETMRERSKATRIALEQLEYLSRNNTTTRQMLRDRIQAILANIKT